MCSTTSADDFVPFFFCFFIRAASFLVIGLFLTKSVDVVLEASLSSSGVTSLFVVHSGNPNLAGHNGLGHCSLSVILEGAIFQKVKDEIIKCTIQLQLLETK